jgi:hypothetical protein
MTERPPVASARLAALPGGKDGFEGGSRQVQTDRLSEQSAQPPRGCLIARAESTNAPVVEGVEVGPEVRDRAEFETSS